MQNRSFELNAPFKPSGDQPAAIQKLVSGLQDALMYQTLLGVTGSGKTFTIANVIQATQRPALVLAPNKTLAAQFYSELCSFFPKNAVEYFVSYYDYYQPEAYVPSTDTYIGKESSINEQIERMRLSATKSLLERKDTLIVATVSAIYGLGDPKSYLSMVLTVAVGETLDQRHLLHRLADMQYTRNDLELQRATYRVRGDVIDIFPADSERTAVRIALFDDQVESIRWLDPLTGQVLNAVERVMIFPKTHYVTPRDQILATVEQMKTDLTIRLKELEANKKLVEAQRLEQRTRFDIEMLLELGYCAGIENYSRYLSGRAAGEPPPTLMEYLPADALLVIDESHVTIPQLIGMYRGDRARKENLVTYGFRLPCALDNRPLRFDEFERLSPQTIFVSATPGDYELERSSQPIELLVRPTGLLDPAVEVRPVATQVDDLLSEIQQRAAQKERVLVTTLTKRMAEDLTDYLSEHAVRVRYLHSDVASLERVEIIRDLRLGVFDVLVGINLLREGLDLPEVSLVAILDADKEGFLRSERSLIQTIGRAARHLHGKAILYADQETGSMKRALEETHRRRNIQRLHNEKHNITPKGIEKAVHLVLESAQTGDSARAGFSVPQQVAEAAADYLALSPKQLAKRLAALEKQMQQHAQNLEFEAAAELRDQIQHIQKVTMGVVDQD